MDAREKDVLRALQMCTDVRISTRAEVEHLVGLEDHLLQEDQVETVTKRTRTTPSAPRQATGVRAGDYTKCSCI